MGTRSPLSPSSNEPQAMRMIEEALGRPMGMVFSFISEDPIAAASLGQVYKAVLRETGEEVAIKVRGVGFWEQVFVLVTVRQAVRGLWAPASGTLCLHPGTHNAPIQVQRPGVEPTVLRDLFFFRIIGGLLTRWSLQRLGCNAELIVDEFAEKLLEELDYVQEARNIEVGQGDIGRGSFIAWKACAGRRT